MEKFKTKLATLIWLTCSCFLTAEPANLPEFRDITPMSTLESLPLEKACQEIDLHPDVAQRSPQATPSFLEQAQEEGVQHFIATLTQPSED